MIFFIGESPLLLYILLVCITVKIKPIVRFLLSGVIDGYIVQMQGKYRSAIRLFRIFPPSHIKTKLGFQLFIAAGNTIGFSHIFAITSITSASSAG